MNEETPLQCCCRDIVKDLLEHNADVLACNSQGKWSLDMASPKSDVWSMLYKEVQWRSFLEQPRPCHIILVRSSCQNLPTGALLKNLVLVSCNNSLLGGSLHQIINIFVMLMCCRKGGRDLVNAASLLFWPSCPCRALQEGKQSQANFPCIVSI